MADDGALSPREQQVWALLAQGLSNKEIANQLGLAVGTVKTYLHRLYRKLRVSSRVEAALAYGARWGSGGRATDHDEPMGPAGRDMALLEG